MTHATYGYENWTFDSPLFGHQKLFSRLHMGGVKMTQN